jgi:hypothetical protein
MVDEEMRSPVSADGISGKLSKGSFDVGTSMVVVGALSVLWTDRIASR